MWKNWKYLIAYLAPLAAYAGIYAQGIWSFGSIYIGFLLIPVLEFMLPASTDNFEGEEEGQRATSLFFDVLLYLNIPILYGLIAYYFYTLDTQHLALYEIIGMTFSVGLIVGTIGINVAHELGHRVTAYEKVMAKILLLPALYMHFIIEHNRGHHKKVATPEDPASARYGEPIYMFWWRSVSGSYRNAWALENRRLTKAGLPVLSWSNEMLRFTLFQVAYLVVIGLVFNLLMVGFGMAIAIFGFLMLESVNYIEHYGLQRQKLASGHYEKVSPRHSWNSNHEVGRIFLYELTRHSDHHFKATRKYQVLRHFGESPQLPFGYPAAILTALIPPLWFSIMNKRVKTFT
ncbi:MAG: alkane 1-monooxygenase [Saprospiraceae bacterium]|nr:MAG: alkane 1-monooxygenase [Saprospiraceae bacterium]